MSTTTLQLGPPPGRPGSQHAFSLALTKILHQKGSGVDPHVVEKVGGGAVGASVGDILVGAVGADDVGETLVGNEDGAFVGVTVGKVVGVNDGTAEGLADGASVGTSVGPLEGTVVGEGLVHVSQ